MSENEQADATYVGKEKAGERLAPTPKDNIHPLFSGILTSWQEAIISEPTSKADLRD